MKLRRLKQPALQIGTLVKASRIKKSWTQDVAAEKIGIDRSWLNKIETQNLVPKPSILHKMREAMNVNSDLLLSIALRSLCIKYIKLYDGIRGNGKGT